MTRKDTIIIAVFVNAALLIALFISAIKSEEVHSSSPDVSSIDFPLATVEKVPVKTADQLETVLKDLPEPPMVKKEKAAPKIDFVKELEAITTSQPAPEKSLPVVKDRLVAEVTVKKGDFLEKIARDHHCSVEKIVEINHLSNTVLQIGQVLKLPSAVEEKAKPTAQQSPGIYIVKAGDNPWSIAVKNKMKVDELLKLNQLDEEKARRLKPGDKLRIK